MSDSNRQFDDTTGDYFESQCGLNVHVHGDDRSLSAGIHDVTSVELGRWRKGRDEGGAYQYRTINIRNSNGQSISLRLFRDANTGD